MSQLDVRRTTATKNRQPTDAAKEANPFVIGTAEPPYTTPLRYERLAAIFPQRIVRMSQPSTL